MEFITNSAHETINFAKNFIKTITLPNIILLSGDLGAGKTTFAKGLALGLNIFENVTSPTFTILNEYNSNPKFFHFDMYRLSSKEEAYELGFEDYFNKNEGIILVEWAENVKGLIHPPYFQINIEKVSDNIRKLTIKEIKRWTYYV